MIRHRFIVSEADFKVFAAIPTELKLLTWGQWKSRTDWAGLRLLIERSTGVFSRLAERWDDVARGFRAISNTPVPGSLGQAEEGEGERGERRLKAAQAVEAEILSSTCVAEADRGKRILSLFSDISDDEMRGLISKAYDAIEPAKPRDLERDVVGYVANLRTFLVRVAGGVSTGSVDELVDSSRKHAERLDRLLKAGYKDKRLQVLDKEDAVVILNGVKDLYMAYDVLMVIFREILDEHELSAMLVKEISALDDPPLPADLECPVGIPFAAYTIELGERRINVVEGRAWAEAVHHFRDDARGVVGHDAVHHDVVATEAEKRVAEIVTQMMVERGLNPKAPTRIAVREADPKQAHYQRAAEERPGPPRVRTIKYHVAPPRYLREAAERILASHVRAHWVVGHWRNQPFGEGRKQHHQTWIKPHIRGLGEAGSTVVKVVAETQGRTEGQKTEGAGDGRA